MKIQREFRDNFDIIYLSSPLGSVGGITRCYDIIGAGLSVAGGALSAYATMSEGSQADKLSRITMRQYEAEAVATEQAGEYEANLKREESQRTKATQIATMMANGGLLTGSNLLILADTAKNYEADALVIARNYKIEATKLRTQGALIRYQGRMAKRNSRIRAMAGIFTGASQLSQATGWGWPAAKTQVAPTTSAGSNYSSMFSNTQRSQGAGMGIWNIR